MFYPWFLKLIGETNLTCTVFWQENTSWRSRIYTVSPLERVDPVDQPLHLFGLGFPRSPA
jgi:hypothetical protein